MKHILFLIIISLYAQISFGQVLSNCTNNANLIFNTYADDINYLAVERLYDIHHPDTSLIIVPQLHKDSILKAMLGVYNLGTQLEADSVFSLYCIHEFHSYYKGIFLKIDTSISWTQAWENQQIATTNPQINNLVNTHGFSFGSIHYISDTAQVILQTNNNINLRAFCDSIAQINGINSAVVDTLSVIGNQMEYNYLNNVAQLKFAVRFKPTTNAIWHKSWNYSVDNNCQVSMTKNSNNPSYNPAFVNCNLWPTSTLESTEPIIKFYPNPSSDKFTITTKEKGSATLRDFSGRIVKQSVIENNSIIMDLSEYPNGIYLLEFRNKRGVSLQKIIKR